MEDYKCNTCSKVFIEKKSLVRHMKNAHEKQQKHKCELCEKDFSRLSDLRCHKKSTHYITSEVQCPKCNKILNRADNIKYHKCKQTAVLSVMKDSPSVSNEAALSSIDAPPTSNKSFDEPPAKKRKYFNCSMKPDQHKLLENEELTESGPEVKDFMQKYWGSIRSFTKKGKVQNIFNTFYDRDFKDLIETIAERIMIHQKHRFKINCSLAFILKNIETKELRYYHSSFNNVQILETALLINNKKDLINFLNSLAEESFYDGLTRPDMKWKVVQISNITFYANSLKDAPLGAGASLPSYIANNHGLANVSGDDNLCFIRCLAVHRGSGRWWWWRYEHETKKLFNDYCMHFNTVPNTFVGVNLSGFIDLEDFFKINLVVYELEEGVAELIQRSWELYSETMRLNIWENHLSLIVDFEHYCRVYQCIHCGKLWDRNCHYYRHTKTSKTTVRDLFPGGIHKNPATIFENLKKSVSVSLQTKDFFLILPATISKPISLKKIYLEMVQN